MKEKRDITLQWKDPNIIEKGHKVYRSKEPMDINNMPDAIAELGKNTTEYIDKDQTIGDTNYYRVSAWIEGYEVFSKEIEIEISSILYISSNLVRVVVFNSGTFEEIVRLKTQGHTNTVNDITIDKDGYVYTVSDDNTLLKSDPSGNEVWRFWGHTGNVNGVAVDDDGYVYSAGGFRDETVRKISPDGNEVWVFEGHSSTVNGVAVDADGYVYSGSRDDTVRKIDPDGNEVQLFDFISPSDIDITPGRFSISQGLT